MIIYADEDFYKTEYLQGRTAVLTTAYAYFFREASAIIKAYTLDNINPVKIPDCVKYCTCELAESIKSRDDKLLKNSENLTSESVGGWSKSYGSSADVQNAFESSSKYIIYKWLGGSGLLCRGLD